MLSLHDRDKEIKSFVQVVPSPVSILAVDDLCLLRMKFQLAFS